MSDASEPETEDEGVLAIFYWYDDDPEDDGEQPALWWLDDLPWPLEDPSSPEPSS